MENIVRNVSDIPLQPEGSYLSCLNSSTQYKAPRSYQMNKVDESVDKTTNCKAGEGASTIAPEIDDSSWSSRSRDWSEEVECATGDTENELNSSPQHQVTTESERLSDIKRKQTLRSPQNVCNEISKYGGIGRGKHRVKPPHLQNIEFDRRVQDNSMLCNNAETNSDLPPVNTMQTVLVENNSPCNSSLSEDIGCDDVPKDSMKKSPIFQDSEDANILPVQAQLNGAYSLQGDARTRNMSASNVDHHVRDYDYKKMQNGIDTFHRGYRNKAFRMNRMPNNNGSNQLAYKGFDNRTFPHRFPPPMQSNLKGYSRGVKGHENHYRHHDNRRHQPSSRQPFPVAIDKMVYTKHKGNVYAEREFSVFDVNRNFQSPNYSIQNEINRHITGSGSYVPQTNVAAFRTKHNVPRIGNCDKIMCNKNEPPGNAKAWHGGNVYTDSNTSTVSCHRTVVTPMKSMVPRGHCAICTSHPHAKHCPSLKEENIHSEKVEFPDSCENFNPEQHPQTYGVISKVEQSTKLNCNPDYSNIRDSRIPPNDSNYNVTSNRERLSVNDLANSNCGYLPGSDPETKSHLLEKARSPDKNAPCLREKMVFPSMHLRKDLHSEKTETSPKMSPGNVPMSKQPSADFSDSDSSHNLMFLGDSHYMSSPVSAVPHSSYADVIRMPANTASKVSSCQMSNCIETAGPKNEYMEMTHEKVQAKAETEHPNSSSEWIMSRLSQIDMNAGNLTNVNGIAPSHQMASNVQQSVNPRPIAVSLEKPSFYNSKVAIGNLSVQQSNLSSPERRILECQYVEEHLSNVVAYKKSGEKLTFLSELPSNLVSSGEHSSTGIPGNIRTDSTFSDSSSVCSSMSGTFKADGHCQMLKPNTPPVIIMNNYGPTEDIQELSFGIEMDEIMKLCGESDVDSVGDSPMTIGDAQMIFLSDSGFCTGKSHDVASCEVGVLNEETCVLEKEDNMAARYITVGNKKFLWKDNVDVSRCNMPQIVGFLQDSVGESATSPVKFYSEE